MNNNMHCDWDGGDCCQSTCVSANGGAHADQCGPFDCRDPSAAQKCPADIEAVLLGRPAPSGDGFCDAVANVDLCGWDGGDCCAQTCLDGTFECGTAGFNCLDPLGLGEGLTCEHNTDCPVGTFCGALTTEPRGRCLSCVYSDYCEYVGVDGPESCEDACFGVADCNGADASAYQQFIGDSVCDDGEFGYSFNCEAFKCDGWDCECPDKEGTTTDATGGADGPKKLDDTGAMMISDCSGNQIGGEYLSWLGDGLCDDGSYGIFFDCDAYNCDGGDCDCGCATSACPLLNGSRDAGGSAQQCEFPFVFEGLEYRACTSDFDEDGLKSCWVNSSRALGPAWVPCDPERCLPECHRTQLKISVPPSVEGVTATVLGLSDASVSDPSISSMLELRFAADTLIISSTSERPLEVTVNAVVCGTWRRSANQRLCNATTSTIESSGVPVSNEATATNVVMVESVEECGRICVGAQWAATTFEVGAFFCQCYHDCPPNLAYADDDSLPQRYVLHYFSPFSSSGEFSANTDPALPVEGDPCTCDNSCLGHTCDDWVRAGITCSELREDYGCACRGCSCTDIGNEMLCKSSDDCVMDGYYCARVDNGDGDTQMCYPCEDANGVDCEAWGHSVDGCSRCTSCTDCDGLPCAGFEDVWVSDSVCDAGMYGRNFNCSKFQYDGGDCIAASNPTTTLAPQETLATAQPESSLLTTSSRSTAPQAPPLLPSSSLPPVGSAFTIKQDDIDDEDVYYPEVDAYEPPFGVYGGYFYHLSEYVSFDDYEYASNASYSDGVGSYGEDSPSPYSAILRITTINAASDTFPGTSAENFAATPTTEVALSTRSKVGAKETIDTTVAVAMTSAVGVGEPAATTGIGNGCVSVCFMYECDYWVAMSSALSCEALEDVYGCNCAGCDCAAMDVSTSSPSSTPSPASSVTAAAVIPTTMAQDAATSTPNTSAPVSNETDSASFFLASAPLKVLLQLSGVLSASCNETRLHHSHYLKEEVVGALGVAKSTGDAFALFQKHVGAGVAPWLDLGATGSTTPGPELRRSLLSKTDAQSTTLDFERFCGMLCLLEDECSWYLIDRGNGATSTMYCYLLSSMSRPTGDDASSSSHMGGVASMMGDGAAFDRDSHKQKRNTTCIHQRCEADSAAIIKALADSAFAPAPSPASLATPRVTTEHFHIVSPVEGLSTPEDQRHTTTQIVGEPAPGPAPGPLQDPDDAIASPDRGDTSSALPTYFVAVIVVCSVVVVIAVVTVVVLRVQRQILTVKRLKDDPDLHLHQQAGPPHRQSRRPPHTAIDVQGGLEDFQETQVVDTNMVTAFQAARAAQRLGRVANQRRHRRNGEQKQAGQTRGLRNHRHHESRGQGRAFSERQRGYDADELLSSSDAETRRSGGERSEGSGRFRPRRRKRLIFGRESSSPRGSVRSDSDSASDNSSSSTLSSGSSGDDSGGERVFRTRRRGRSNGRGRGHGHSHGRGHDHARSRSRSRGHRHNRAHGHRHRSRYHQTRQQYQATHSLTHEHDSLESAHVRTRSDPFANRKVSQSLGDLLDSATHHGQHGSAELATKSDVFTVDGRDEKVVTTTGACPTPGHSLSTERPRTGVKSLKARIRAAVARAGTPPSGVDAAMTDESSAAQACGSAGGHAAQQSETTCAADTADTVDAASASDSERRHGPGSSLATKIQRACASASDTDTGSEAEHKMERRRIGMSRAARAALFRKHPDDVLMEGVPSAL